MELEYSKFQIGDLIEFGNKFWNVTDMTIAEVDGESYWIYQLDNNPEWIPEKLLKHF